MDGVIANCALAVANLLQSDEDPNEPGRDVKPYKFSELIGTNAWETALNQGVIFWREIPPYSWATKLYNTCDALDKTVILTNPFNGEHTADTVRGKLDWLEHHLKVSPKDVIFSSSKRFMARPTGLLIDDLEDNVVEWKLLGGRGIIFPRPWNSRFTLTNGAFETTLSDLLTIYSS
jgi:hypothetical protein